MCDLRRFTLNLASLLTAPKLNTEDNNGGVDRAAVSIFFKDKYYLN